MAKSISSGTLSMLDTIRSKPRYQETSSDRTSPVKTLHVNLLRDQVRDCLNAICSLFKTSDKDSREVVDNIKSILVEEEGFQWDDAYAVQQVTLLLAQDKCHYALQTLYTYLTVARVDAHPRSLEAQRRLLFFTNSLFMDLPQAPPIREMTSMTTLTPFYAEDILYSYADLQKTSEDGNSVFMYLQTIYPYEWKNFCQRVGVSNSGNLTSKELEARLWASKRGQTLGRTCDGMMLYERALQFLASIENPRASEGL